MTIKIRSILLLFAIASTAVLCSCQKSDENNKGSDNALTDSIVGKAKEMVRDGNRAMMFHYVDSAYRHAGQLSEIDLWKKYNLYYKIYLEYQLDTIKSGLYIDSMAFVLKKKEGLHKEEQALTLFAKGDLLLAEKKYAEAFNSYFKGREYAEKNLGQCSLAKFTTQLAMVKYNQLQMADAISYFKQAWTENNSCKDKKDFENRLVLPQHLLHMIGLSYGQLRTIDSKDSAVYYFKKGIGVIDQNESLFPEHRKTIEAAKGEIYGDLGGTYMFQSKDEQAERYLLESIRINSSTGYNRFDAASSMIDLSYLYIRAGKFKQAMSYIDQLKRDLRVLDIKKSELTDLKLNLNIIQLHYYEGIKNIDSAYLYQKKSLNFRDSLRRVEKGLYEADMGGAFKLLVQERDHKVNRIYLTSAVFLFLMVITILFIVLKSRRELARINSQVVAKNNDLYQTLGALRQSQDENMHMLNTIAHDLRSPIAATVSLSSLLLEMKDHSAESEDMLMLIKNANLHSLEMTENLLTMNAVYDNLYMEPIEVKSLLNYCVRMLAFKADEKEQRIVLEIPEVTISANREKIWRLFGNLITNAIKFSPKGSRINILAVKEGSVLRFSVQDHGIGIPLELQNKVFNSFTDAKREGTSGESSFGLGLSICRQIVEAHNGRIWFVSGLDQGTTFYVELPL